MVSYDSILHVSSGDEVCSEFFGEPNSGPHEIGGEKPPVLAAASFSVSF